MSVRLGGGLQVDLRVVPAESFGAALQYFTGSKGHNVILRGRAKSAGLKINEYGVFRGEESIAGFVTPRCSIGRGCLGKSFLLHGKCRFEINLCGFNMFVTEPQCDHRTIDACLQKIHGHGVPQAVDSDTFVLQGRALAGSLHAMLVQQVLHAVDAQSLTLGVGE